MSSSLASLAATINEKDSEKSKVVEEIKKLEELIKQGYKANIKFSLYQIDGIDLSGDDTSVAITYKLDPLLSSKKSVYDNLTNKKLNDPTELLLFSIDQSLDITVTVTKTLPTLNPVANIATKTAHSEPISKIESEVEKEGRTEEQSNTTEEKDYVAEKKEEETNAAKTQTEEEKTIDNAEEKEYLVAENEVESAVIAKEPENLVPVNVREFTASFSLRDAPPDEEMRAEIDAFLNPSTAADNQAPVVFHVKIHLDTFEYNLESKKVELQQAEAVLLEASNALKEAKKNPPSSAASVKTKKNPAVATKRKSKKSAKSATTDSTEGTDIETEAAVSGFSLTSLVEAISQQAVVGAELAVQHRAVFFFAVAAVGIFAYGDYLSV